MPLGYTITACSERSGIAGGSGSGGSSGSASGGSICSSRSSPAHQQDDHLDEQEEGGAEAGEPGVGAHHPGRQEEGQHVAQRPQAQLEQPVSCRCVAGCMRRAGLQTGQLRAKAAAGEVQTSLAGCAQQATDSKRCDSAARLTVVQRRVAPIALVLDVKHHHRQRAKQHL